MVVGQCGLEGIFYGTPEEAWSQAADLSSQIHVEYVPKSYKLILSCAPKMYDDIWVAGKCMYKLEPVLAESGTLIIYAPHISEVSYTHGRILDEIGYHVRDYFVKQWDKYRHYPWGVLAHSTHVKGSGVYEDGIETPRANVVLATQIPRRRCEQISLGYMDYREIVPEEYMNKEDQGVLCVPKAGEILYRLREQ
jgi:nickel-dependent lactate racemase